MTLEDLEPCRWVSKGMKVYARWMDKDEKVWWVPCEVTVAFGDAAYIYNEQYEIDRLSTLDNLMKRKDGNS